MLRARSTQTPAALGRVVRFGLLCASWGSACQRDDILVAADEKAPVADDIHAAPDEAAPGVASWPGGSAPRPSSPRADGVPGAAGAPGAQPGSAVAGQPVPGVPGLPVPGLAGQPVPGVAGQPVPGVAVQATAGVPSAPTPGIPEAPKPAPPGTPQLNSGPQVAISGSVAFATYTQGAVRVTVFSGDHSRPSSAPTRVLGLAEIPRPGFFSLTVPEGSGKVYIEGSIDEDMDGRPGPQEPQGKADRYPLTVAAAPITGVEVDLKRVAPPPAGSEKQDDF